MVKSTTEIAKWCKLIAVVVSAGVVCSGPTFPQLIAQIAALDHDHGVTLSASGEELRLVLTHDHDRNTPTERDRGPSMAAAEERSHVIVIPAGSTVAKQTMSVGSEPRSTISEMFAGVCARDSDIFVPQPTVMNSRPPPGAMSILSAHRGTLLLI